MEVLRLRLQALLAHLKCLEGNVGLLLAPGQSMWGGREAGQRIRPV